MVTGMERFRQHFTGYEDAFVVIGGAACDVWFARAGTHFRTTKDIDMVLVIEAVHPSFVRHFWAFIRDGGYQAARPEDDKRTYYRFIKPAAPDFPKMIELFSSAPLQLEPVEKQKIIPIAGDDDVSSLSAILMDKDYYGFILDQREVVDGLPLIKPSGLIPLKAHAWRDMSSRRAAGDTGISDGEINKHRSDIFRLATLLPEGATVIPPEVIAADLRTFLAAFPATSPEWDDIARSLKASGIRMSGSELTAMIRDFFGITV